MDAATLEALEGSIAKWRAVADGTGVDDGTENCPLCVRFYGKGKLCAGCPVREKTGEPYCDDTPYEVWDGMQYALDRDFSDSYVADTPELKAIALKEVAFLEALRPLP